MNLLSVIVPVYNELTTIRRILQRIQNVPLPIEIILVDDCSNDGTREILKEIQNKIDSGEIPSEGRGRIKIIYHEKNQGKGAAIRTGIQHAKGEIALIQDADMEYNPAEYPRLIEPILAGDADVVYGSRFRGDRRRVLYFWHTLGNNLLTLISNICTNLNLTDMETCYKVFKTEIIKNIPIRSNRFGFEPEITAKIAKLRCAIYEVPISYQGRSYSEGKKINWKDGISALYTILKFFLIEDLYEETAGLRTLRIMEGAGKYNEWLFQQAKPYLGRRVVEVGAGVGNITKFLLNKDFVMATDVIDFYLEELRRNFQGQANVKVEKLDLLDETSVRSLGGAHHFDSLLSMNVLEHIEDDKEALLNMNRLLTEKGKLLLLVPAHDLCYSEMDKNLGHFRRYNKKKLTILLDQAGFRIQKIKYLNAIGAIGWFVNGRIFRRKLIPSRQLRAFDVLVKILALEKFFEPPFGLSMMAIAEKK